MHVYCILNYACSRTNWNIFSIINQNQHLFSLIIWWDAIIMGKFQGNQLQTQHKPCLIAGCNVLVKNQIFLVIMLLINLSNAKLEIKMKKKKQIEKGKQTTNSINLIIAIDCHIDCGTVFLWKSRFLLLSKWNRPNNDFRLILNIKKYRIDYQYIAIDSKTAHKCTENDVYFINMSTFVFVGNRRVSKLNSIYSWTIVCVDDIHKAFKIFNSCAPNLLLDRLVFKFIRWKRRRIKSKKGPMTFDEVLHLNLSRVSN